MIIFMEKGKYQNMRETNDRTKESINRVERRERVESVESLETEKERAEKA